ncbi:MAG: glycosyltransferase, partial [Ruminococcus flavefaciens]
MRKKVCFVSTTSITMKCFIIPIAHELAKTGINVTLICDNDESMFQICEEKGLTYHPIHMGRGIDISGLKAIKEIKQFLKSERFDLVQYCTPNAACYTSIAAKLAQIPKRLYCQWGIRYVGLSGISRKLFKVIEKIVCYLSTDIRAVSWKNRDYAVSEGLYKSKKASVVGNGGTIGVDMSQFDINKKSVYNTAIRKQCGISEDAFVFGFCGRLSRDK